MTHLRFSSELADYLRDSGLQVVVTGARGWLGQAALEMLDGAYGDQLSERVIAYGSASQIMSLRSGRSIFVSVLDDIKHLSNGRYFFLHFAFLTKDRVADLSLDDFVRRNDEIGEYVSAAARRLDVAGLFLPSSGAVYRLDRSLDIDLEKNPYGVMKVRDEARFASLARERNFPLAIARVFNIAGPFINKLGNYALSSIILNILRSEPIHLRASHPIIRSYVHVEDLINVALASLMHGPVPVLFDTAGKHEIEIGRLAQLAASTLGKPDYPILRPTLCAGPVNRYVGDGRAFAQLATRFGITLSRLSRQIEDTAAFLAADSLSGP